MFHHGGTESTERAIPDRERLNQLAERVIGAAIEVHRQLGPGLLESTYEVCLCHELSERGIQFQRQVDLPVRYKGLLLDAGYRIDIVIEGCLILELKSIEQVTDLHKAQLLTYLRLFNAWLGILLNFNVPLTKNGIHRMANGPG
jgi:GxxExxY protein